MALKHLLVAVLLALLTEKCFSQITPICPDDEIFLNDFFSNSSGASWTTNTGWSPLTPGAAGDGIFGVTLSAGDGCYIVDAIQLSNNLLSGNITEMFASTSFEFTSNLTTLDLSNNNIFGNIPLTLTSHETLANIDLRNNALTGDIPSEFQLIDQPQIIQSLFLAGNMFDCPLANSAEIGGIVTDFDAINTLCVSCPILSVPTNGSITYSDALNSLNNYPNTTTATYDCTFGFSVNDASVRTCTADMTDTSAAWDGSATRSCGPITDYCTAAQPDNTTVDSQSTEITGDVVYSCQAGYEHTSGNLTRTCLAVDATNGDYDGSPPVCSPIVDFCTAPTQPGNTNIISESTEILGEIVYNCSNGYQQDSGDAVRTCVVGQDGSTGVFSGVDIVCLAIPTYCETLSPAENTTITSQSNEITGEAVYSCQNGYEIESGNTIRTCLAGNSTDGSFNGTELRCSAITDYCTAAQPDNTNVDSQSTEITGDVVYSCQAGYEHTSGNLTRTCLAVDATNGDYNGSAPVCSPIADFCTAPTQPGNTNIISESTEILGEIVYNCSNGYQQDSGDAVRTCVVGQDGSTGVFSGVDIVCLAIPTYCETLSPAENTTITSQSNDITGEAVYACQNGYEFDSGDTTRTCLAGNSTDGSFNGTELRCSAIPTYCAPLSPALNTTITSQSNEITGEAVYSCQNGYEFESGNTTRTCLAGNSTDGSFNGTELRCSAIPTYCETLSPAENTIITSQSNEITGEAIYSCQNGYEFESGNTTRTCLAGNSTDGSFNGTELRCSAIPTYCAPLSPALNTTITSQ
eukprot:142221_1